MSSMMVWLLLSVKRLTSSDIGDTDCSTVNATSLMRITIAALNKSYIRCISPILFRDNACNLTEAHETDA